MMLLKSGRGEVAWFVLGIFPMFHVTFFSLTIMNDLVTSTIVGTNHKVYSGTSELIYGILLGLENWCWASFDN